MFYSFWQVKRLIIALKLVQIASFNLKQKYREINTNSMKIPTRNKKLLQKPAARQIKILESCDFMKYITKKPKINDSP